MLFAARCYKEGTHTLACAWRAMYDAAPEVKQKPVAWVEVVDSYEGPYKFHGAALLGIGKHNLYTFPPDAQAEITQLKSVIAKCNSALMQCKQWKEGSNILTCHNHKAVEEALAAIKEEGL